VLIAHVSQSDVYVVINYGSLNIVARREIPRHAAWSVNNRLSVAWYWHCVSPPCDTNSCRHGKRFYIFCTNATDTKGSL